MWLEYQDRIRDHAVAITPPEALERILGHAEQLIDKLPKERAEQRIGEILYAALYVVNSVDINLDRAYASVRDYTAPGWKRDWFKSRTTPGMKPTHEPTTYVLKSLKDEVFDAGRLLQATDKTRLEDVLGDLLFSTLILASNHNIYLGAAFTKAGAKGNPFAVNEGRATTPIHRGDEPLVKPKDTVGHNV